MREIKLRAWNLLLAKWDYFSLQDLTNRDIVWGYYKNWCEFIGLKDKNSKEIYEADIVSTEDCDGFDGILSIVKFGEYVDKEVKENVCSALFGFYLSDIEDKSQYVIIPKEMSDAYKVIGNIYENSILEDKFNEPISK